MTPSATATSHRRSSVSRRHLIGLIASPQQRARSAERNVPEPEREEAGIDSGGTADEHGGLCLRRCDSDPFDSTGDDPVVHSEASGNIPARPKKAIPTLPRFPIAETKNLNCWSEPPAKSSFNVRGSNFLKDKKKIPSGPYAFPARGADLILTNQHSGPCSGIATNPAILGGLARNVPTFMLNFIFPWGVLVNYFEIPDMYLPFLRSRYNALQDRRNGENLPPIDSFAPHQRAIIRFLLASNEERNTKLKLIPVCIEGPWVVRQMVAGKPAIIGKRLPVNYTYHPANKSQGLAECFEADLDISASDPMGKKVVNLCRRYMSAVTVDVGIVIEGVSKDELPEQMLGCVRLHRLDALMAPMLPPL